MNLKLIRMLLAWLVLLCSPWVVFAQVDTATMTAALSLREDVAKAVREKRDPVAGALARLKAAASPSGLKLDRDTDFALAAMDVGQRLLAAGDPESAEPFVRRRQIEKTDRVSRGLNRGNYQTDIFRSTKAKAAFLKCLGETCQQTGWQVPATRSRAPAEAGPDYTLQSLTLFASLAKAVREKRDPVAGALARLKASASPSGLKLDRDTDFALAAMDVGQRLLAAGDPESAEPFVRRRQIEKTDRVSRGLNRGNYQTDLFRSTKAKAAFLKCLGKTCQQTGWQVPATRSRAPAEAGPDYTLQSLTLFASLHDGLSRDHAIEGQIS
jgi:hypothetical protein